MASLQKLGQRCRERRSSLAEVHNLKEDYKEQVTQQRERFVRDLMYEQVENLESDAIEKQYRLKLTGPCIQAFVLKLDNVPGTFTDASLEIILEKARYSIHNQLSALCKTLVIHFEKTEGCGILCFEPQQHSNVRSALREVVNQLTVQRPMFGPISFSPDWV